MRPFQRARLLAALLVGGLLVGGTALALPRAWPEPSDADRARAARQLLTDARAFLRQERPEAAERALRRGLALAPDNPRLHHLLARVLDAAGHGDEAARHRRRADELDPAPPPLPASALAASSSGILVALVPPGENDEPIERVPAEWPDGVAAATLVERLRVRLPHASVAYTSPKTVAEARLWLAARSPRGAISLRVDRSFCGDTLKDGRFGVAWLRVAGEVPGATGDGP